MLEMTAHNTTGGDDDRTEKMEGRREERKGWKEGREEWGRENVRAEKRGKGVEGERTDGRNTTPRGGGTWSEIRVDSSLSTSTSSPFRISTVAP
jgi:hypothetical protein